MKRVPSDGLSWRSASVPVVVFALVIALSGCAVHREPIGPSTPPRAHPIPAPQSGELPTGQPDGSADEREAPRVDASGSDAIDQDLVDLDPLSADGEDEEEVAPAPHDELAVSPPVPTAEEVEREKKLVPGGETFDIPMVVNEKVTAWLDYFSGPHKAIFTASLVRSGRYLDMARRAFEEAGIPRDLAYMAHVESGFKPKAYSRAKAKGIFQFIAETGRRYGLHADAWVDERSDPEESARAAASYLRDLYAEFNDWYLALAAYNAGEGRIRRAVATTGSHDFWAIARTSAIRSETRNYVPAILAAALIAKSPAQYGFEYVPDPPLAYEETDVHGAVDLGVLARRSGIDVTSLKDLNPHLRRGQTPPGRTTRLRVPVGLGEVTQAALVNIPPAESVATVRHVVRKGESLGSIAKRYHVSVRALQRANRLGTRSTLRAGRTLVIPGAHAAVGEESAADGAGRPRARSSHVAYRVRRGDTLSSIARRFGTTAARIAAASGIGVHEKLTVGETLEVPATGRSEGSRPSVARGGGSGFVHTIRRGDTLWNIAARYQVSVERLCALNEISREETLVPGRRLTIRVN